MDSRRLSVLVLTGVTALVGLLCVGKGQARTTLIVHAGAGIRPPLDELGRVFEKKTGTHVDYSFKGSGCLVADLCLSKRGDVFIPGEPYYMDQARKKGFIRRERVVARMETVLIVQKGNPKKIRGLADLTRPGLRIGMGDPKAVAVGRAANQCLVKARVLDKVQRNVVMSALNVVELGIGVKLHHLDAAVVWDATARLFKNAVDVVPLTDRVRVECPIPVGVLTFTRSPRQAEDFLNFLASDEARRIFLKHGYSAPRPNGKERRA